MRTPVMAAVAAAMLIAAWAPTAATDAVRPLTLDEVIRLVDERDGSAGIAGRCPEGLVLRVLIPYPGVPGDWEWAADLLPWRAHPLFALVHFPPAPALNPDGVWVDTTGDGLWNREHLGPEVGHDGVRIPHPCLTPGPAMVL